MNRWFQLRDDLHVPNRWHLGTPRRSGAALEPDCFSRGMREQSGSGIVIPISIRGVALDYTNAELDVPVLSARTADALTSVVGEEAQLLEVRIDGMNEAHFIANATHSVDCVDERASAEARRWTEADGRPDRVGDYRVVAGLRVDPDRAEGSRFFRVKGWEVALIVSEAVKTAFERVGVVGARFTGV